MHENLRKLEHISLRAWAALETESYDGWLLRYANGYTGRANSVQALDASSLPLAEKIAYCENWYAERGLPCIFRLTEAMQPGDLEAVLEKRAYRRYNETLVQTASLSMQDFVLESRFHFSNGVTDDWLSAWGIWNAVSQTHIATARAMLSKTSAQKCFGWLDDCALGLAVCEGEHVGLFDIVVHPEYRRQGLGAMLVKSLLGWGKQLGANRAYLQVVAENVPALQLYDTLGFRTHHHYWYRRREEVS